MSEMEFDEELARSYVGKKLTADLVYLGVDGQQQNFQSVTGIVKSIDATELTLQLDDGSGEQIDLPTDLASIQLMEAGGDLRGQWTFVEQEPAAIWRWLQIACGVFLTPLSLLCCAGAATIFTIEKVQGSFVLMSLAAVILLCSLWSVTLAIRLLMGRSSHHRWLFGPYALRLIAVFMVVLVLAAFWNGYFLEKPLAIVLGISYLLGAKQLWSLARQRQVV